MFAGACRADRDAAASLRRLDRVDDQVAEDAAEREAVAFDGERTGGEVRFDRDAVTLAVAAHRFDDF